MDHFIKVKSIKISMPAGFVLPMVRRKAVCIELETQGSELTAVRQCIIKSANFGLKSTG